MDLQVINPVGVIKANNGVSRVMLIIAIMDFQQDSTKLKTNDLDVAKCDMHLFKVTHTKLNARVFDVEVQEAHQAPFFYNLTKLCLDLETECR